MPGLAVQFPDGLGGPSPAGVPCASSTVALRSFAALRELREGLRYRICVRQDVEHPAPFERRTDDPLVKLGRNVDAAMSDAVIVRRRRCKAFDASLGRDARSGWVDGDRGIVVHPQHAPGVDRRTETAHKATRRRGAIPARNLAKRETGNAGGRMIADRRAEEPGRRAAKPAVAAEHQDLCGGLVYDRERIALAVLCCDNPARELDHRVRNFLAWRKLVGDGYRLRGSILGAGRANARERQHQRQRAVGGPDRRVWVRTDGTVPSERRQVG